MSGQMKGAVEGALEGAVMSGAWQGVGVGAVTLLDSRQGVGVSRRGRRE